MEKNNALQSFDKTNKMMSPFLLNCFDLQLPAVFQIRSLYGAEITLDLNSSGEELIYRPESALAIKAIWTSKTFCFYQVYLKMPPPNIPTSLDIFMTCLDSFSRINDNCKMLVNCDPAAENLVVLCGNDIAQMGIIARLLISDLVNSHPTILHDHRALASAFKQILGIDILQSRDSLAGLSKNFLGRRLTDSFLEHFKMDSQVQAAATWISSADHRITIEKRVR